MAPTDDEYKSANEPKDDASTRGTFFGRQRFWKRCKQEDEEEDEEPARLTPMPTCLMKWWIPLLLALILLAAGCFLASIWRMPLEPFSWGSINPFWPPSWPFNYHWPSKDGQCHRV